jgi:hypothetical protein
MGVVREVNVTTPEERNLIEAPASQEDERGYRYPPVPGEKPVLNPDAPVITLHPDVYDLSDVLLHNLWGSELDVLSGVNVGGLTRHHVNYTDKTVTAYYFDHLTLQWIKTSASWADKEEPLREPAVVKRPYVFDWNWGRRRSL